MANSTARQYQWFDNFFINMDRSLRSIHTTLCPTHSRPSPSKDVPDAELSEADKKQVASLMRVNHAGEVCAQALYLGQSLTARDKELAKTLQEAAQEEIDHLTWCKERLQELNSHTSYLNPFWFIGSLAIGSFAGLLGDKWSLGFLAETEQQVFNHLGGHLKKLPIDDHKSHAILAQMQAEESQHASTALKLGAATLPMPVKMTMRFASKIMTNLAYHF